MLESTPHPNPLLGKERGMLESTPHPNPLLGKERGMLESTPPQPSAQAEKESELDLTAVDWPRFLRMAAAHRVAPLISAASKNSGISIPDEVAKSIKQEAFCAGRRCMILSEELARISRLLAEHGTPMLALKGPALGVQGYGDACARAMIDLDILVRPEDFAGTRTILETNGFVCAEPVARLAHAYQDVYARRTPHFTFRHAALNYALEVHQRPIAVPGLFPVTVDALMSAATSVRIASTDVRTLSPWDHFLFVAAHGAKHGWYRLLWLADFAALARIHPEWFSGPAGNILGLERVLSAAFQLCQICFETPLPDPATPFGIAIKPDNAVAKIVAHAISRLQVGQPAASSLQNAGDLYNLLRLRPEANYHMQVLRQFWTVTSDDLLTCRLPVPLVGLYPVLRPVLWSIRQLRAKGH
jgi:hypothetical protein